MTDYNHHIGYVDKVDRMANIYSISCQAWKWGKICFSSVQSGHSEQLHPFFFMWWEENLTQRFLTRPSEKHAGCGWTRTTARETHEETTDHLPLLEYCNTDESFNKFWPGPSKQGRCHVYYGKYM